MYYKIVLKYYYTNFILQRNITIVILHIFKHLYIIIIIISHIINDKTFAHCVQPYKQAQFKKIK